MSNNNDGRGSGDDASGPAALDPSIPHRQPGIEAALEALWRVEQSRTRSCSPPSAP